MRERGKRNKGHQRKFFFENYYAGLTVLNQDRYHIIQLSARAEGCWGNCDSCYMKVLVNLSNARKEEIGGKRR